MKPPLLLYQVKHYYMARAELLTTVELIVLAALWLLFAEHWPPFYVAVLWIAASGLGHKLAMRSRALRRVMDEGGKHQ